MEPEPTAWDPESNNALDSITWGKGIAPVPRILKKNFAKRKSKKQNKRIWQTTHLIHHGS